MFFDTSLLKSGRYDELVKGMAAHPVGLVDTFLPDDVTQLINGPCHMKGIPLQNGFFPFCKAQWGK
jgi:hypothetical protein